MNNIFLRRIIILFVILVIAFLGGRELWEIRHFKQSIVVSEDFTEKIMLSDYFDGIKGTWVDTPVYIFDSGNPGGTLLWLGGTHPYEPAASLAAYVAAENIKISKGRIYLIPVANRSAWTMGDYGMGYPKYFTLEAPWGEKKFRIGARNTNPLDQWPDPFTYIHYPSRQQLAPDDIRNLNRTFPGRPDGSLTERLAYAIMELTRKENIDLFVDMHEASLMYPVVSTYVAHQNAEDIAMMAAMTLSAEQFPMKSETSPKNLRGLTHREVGDYSDALVVLMETAEPFIDRVAGKMTEELMVEGKDEFLQRAAEKGLLYCSPEYDIEFGRPMWYRVGRHLSATMELIKQMGFFIQKKRWK
jgi:predicted deacylase